MNDSISSTKVITIAFAFMKSRSTEAYAEIFRTLKRENPELMPPAYMGDHDKAMRAAMRLEFPNVRIYGCLFHFAQCLVKHVGEPAVGLASAIRRPGIVLKNFLAFTAIPLLPAEDIIPVFELCAAEALAAAQQVSVTLEVFLPCRPPRTFVRFLADQYVFFF